MKIFSFFGSSSSGKTTIISNIISELSGSMRIGYIKNIPHDNISLDTEYKDTWKMENAGAYRIYVVRSIYYLDSYQVEYIEMDKYKLEYNEVI